MSLADLPATDRLRVGASIWGTTIESDADGVGWSKARGLLWVELNQEKLVMVTGTGVLQPAGIVTEALDTEEDVDVRETEVVAWIATAVVFVEEVDSLEADVLVGKVPGAVVFVVLLTVDLLEAVIVVFVDSAVVLAVLLALALELVDTDVIQPRS
ncbi:hypothetical protein N0V93_007078 [Gnomoniopsis smithogilvyi]|uniref:Uncharacterized protein n=1 Tax=Gnomoniopsis smithogilvyi TaxID=1191159 RepID=A0A9W8YPE5_9PEZI|nr:hypothetical protein N0V93_007078 [Gnomoniopsis smithogilvyi]